MYLMEERRIVVVGRNVLLGGWVRRVNSGNAVTLISNSREIALETIIGT